MSIVSTTCPRCGKRWVPWARSPLPCHARCYFTSEEQDDIYAFKKFLLASNAHLGKFLGVPVGVIKVSIDEAARRAGKKVSQWGR